MKKVKGRTHGRQEIDVMQYFLKKKQAGKNSFFKKQLKYSVATIQLNACNHKKLQQTLILL